MTAPFTAPGMVRGSTTLKKVRTGPAPKASEACFTDSFTSARDVERGITA